jgi:rhodanese-related sulfurtransferase
MRDAQGVAAIDVYEAARRLQETPRAGQARPLLVDVRESNEFTTARIPGAVLMPLSEFQTSYQRLPKDRPLFMHCAAGKRSLVAAELLKRNGYEDVANVEGGIIAWQKAGHPTRQGPVQPGEGELQG